MLLQWGRSCYSISIGQIHSAEFWNRQEMFPITKIHFSEAPYDRFLSSALKRCFRLSGLLLKLCRSIFNNPKTTDIKFLISRKFEVTIFLRKSEGMKGLPNRKFTETIRWVPLTFVGTVLSETVFLFLLDRYKRLANAFYLVLCEGFFRDRIG